MDSRRHFLRGLARAAAGAGSVAARTESPADPSEVAPEAAPGPAGEPAPPVPASRYPVAPSAPGSGEAARAAIGRSAVLVIGAGALGAPVLGYLAGAGVGRLGVLDHADVTLTDLAAETVHYTPDVGVPKAHSAAVKLGFLNPEIVVEPYQVHLDSGNAEGLLAGQDLAVDCSNDAVTQAVVADTCARLAIPLVSAGAGANGGWVISVPGGEHACPACAGAEATAESESGSVPGTVAGVIGSLQAREALERLAAAAAAPAASALHLDLEDPGLRRASLTRRSDCALCAGR